MDRGAWWAAVHWVVQSRTQLKRLSSSSSKGKKPDTKDHTQCGSHSYEGSRTGRTLERAVLWLGGAGQGCVEGGVTADGTGFPLDGTVLQRAMCLLYNFVSLLTTAESHVLKGCVVWNVASISGKP